MARVNHPPHPRCVCGRALYKAPKKGDRVLSGAPWAFCRNEACSLFGTNQSTPQEPLTAETHKEVRSRAPLRRGLKRRSVPLRNEPDAISKARVRIRTLVADVTKGVDKNAVQLVLAILNQEIGHKGAANSIIDEYRLDEIFGLQRF
jgi:hypothetical protein